MRPQTLDRLKALILVLMAVFFADKLITGKLFYYIGPRFSWLSVMAVALFIILAGAYNLVSERRGDHDHTHEDHDHDHGRLSIGPLLIVALPLILGTIIPPTPLGASAVAARSATQNTTSVAGSEYSLTIVPAERNLLDWVRAINASSDPASLNGLEADVVGFVYRDVRFGEDQFMLGRFTLTCCVADAMAIGLVIQSPQAARLEADTWVRVRGTFTEGQLDGEAVPVLVADDIAPIQPPEQPYLYP